MRTDSEVGLLERFTQSGDADAFGQITRLYADMVYGTCLRITGNQEEAADATQDTFFHLLKHAGKISGSLGGWLHRVATRRAVDRIRRESSRREREQAYATQEPVETDRWSDVSPLVDEAMGEMDEELREVVLLYFLQGQTTVQIAALQSTAQSTVSRHLERALAQLRDKLRSKGVLIAVATLMTLMSQASQAAPAPVLMELGKMAAASGTAAGNSATSLGLGGMKLKLATATLVVVAGLGGWVGYKYSQADTSQPPLATRSLPRPTIAQNTVVQASPTEPQSAGQAGPNRGAVPSVNNQGVAVAGGTQQGAGFFPVGGGRMGGARGNGGAAAPAMGFGGVAAAPVAPSPATPAGAVYRLVSALARGDIPQLQSSFVPGSPEFGRLLRLLESAQTEAEREMKRCYESLGTPVEVVETTPNEDGLKVKWRATVRKPFTRLENGVSKEWQKGEKIELEVRLKQVESEWKVAGF